MNFEVTPFAGEPSSSIDQPRARRESVRLECDEIAAISQIKKHTKSARPVRRRYKSSTRDTRRLVALPSQTVLHRSS